MEPNQMDQEAIREGEIRQLRAATLVATYERLRARFNLIRNGSILHDVLVAQTVEHYIQDRRVLRGRFKIEGRIQRHKIAGLMAGAILKYRPIQINTTRTSVGEDNEQLALYHGLAVCAEKEISGLQRLMQSEYFSRWESDTIHNFQRRPCDTESFMIIFETLSMTYFPNNLKTDD